MDDIDKQINDIFFSTDDVSKEEKIRIFREYVVSVIKRKISYHKHILYFNGKYVKIKIQCKLIKKGTPSYYNSTKIEDLFEYVDNLDFYSLISQPSTKVAFPLVKHEKTNNS